MFAKLPQFIEAAEERATHPGSAWPASLRVTSMSGHPGVWEMTWNFAGPDLRSTFRWTEIDGEQAIAWLRIGDHSIFANPCP